MSDAPLLLTLKIVSIFIATVSGVAFVLIRDDRALKRRFRKSLTIVAVIAAVIGGGLQIHDSLPSDTSDDIAITDPVVEITYEIDFNAPVLTDWEKSWESTLRMYVAGNLPKSSGPSPRNTRWHDIPLTAYALSPVPGGYSLLLLSGGFAVVRTSPPLLPRESDAIKAALLVMQFRIDLHQAGTCTDKPLARIVASNSNSGDEDGFYNLAFASTGHSLIMHAWFPIVSKSPGNALAKFSDFRGSRTCLGLLPPNGDLIGSHLLAKLASTIRAHFHLREADIVSHDGQRLVFTIPPLVRDTEPGYADETYTLQFPRHKNVFAVSMER